MDQFLEFVADILEVDVKDISLETTYNEFPTWDSLMMIRLIMGVEEEYNVVIPIENAQRIKTLNDLYIYTLS